MCRKLIYLISFVLVLSLAGSAQSDISVNFAYGLLLDPADVAGLNPVPNWNNVETVALNAPDSGTLPAGTVIDSTGAVVSGMEVTWSTGASWWAWTPTSPPCTPGDVKLFDFSFVGTPTDPVTVTVTNIPYDVYEVVTYLHCNHVDRGVEVTVAESGITYVGQPPSAVPFDGNYVRATSTDPANPTVGATYTMHTGLTNSTLDIVMTPWLLAPNWPDQGMTLGFQIIPEPATIALLGLGGLALLRRRKGR